MKFVATEKKPSKMEETLTYKHEKWMEDLPETVKNAPVVELAIPGSHDSFTYYLDKSLPVGPDESKALQRLSKMFIFAPLVKKIVYNWSKTQNLGVEDQLKSGIRYFDFRVSKVKGQSELRIIHALYGPKVMDILKEIDNFLVDHKEEVLVLHFQHCYGLSEMDFEALNEMISSTFGSKLCPVVSPEALQELTLNSLTSKGHQVICIYNGFYFPTKIIPNPWANTRSIDYLKNFLTEGLKKRPKGLFFVSQAIFTENFGTIVKHPFSSLEKQLAGKCDFFICHDWLGQMDSMGLKVNIVMADFVEKDGFTDIVISENYKKLERSKLSKQ